MKSLLNLTGLLAVAAVLATGCQPSDTSSTEDIEVVETTAPPQPTIEETVAETADAAKEVVAEVEETVAQASAQAQEILDQAKALVSEKKYEEAGNLLQKLSDFELTPEQQQLLDELTETIQKALESEAVQQGTKALGNILGGEKE